MPKELGIAFKATIDRIKTQSPAKSELAMDVLKWTFLAEEQLKLNELLHALAVSPGDTKLFFGTIFPLRGLWLITALDWSS